MQIAADSRIWVPDGILSRMIEETQKWSPVETGGILAGYCSEDDRHLVITECTIAGPNAHHGKSRYCPDYDFDRQAMAALFDDHDGQLFYLGDWHSHPDREPSLSWLDKHALRNMARFPDNYMESPVMLVLGANESTWRIAGWRVFRRRRGFLFPGWSYRPQAVEHYRTAEQWQPQPGLALECEGPAKKCGG